MSKSRTAATARRRSRDVVGSTASTAKAAVAAGGQLVRAKFQGFYGNARRRAGDEFTIPAGEKLAKWMEPASGKREASKPASETPTGSSGSSTGGAGVL